MRFGALGVSMATVLVGANAHAEGDSHFVVGPSVSYVVGPSVDRSAGIGIDLTYALTHSKGCSQCLFPAEFYVFWASAGARYVFSDRPMTVPYVELGTWFLLNLGLGYSVVVRRDEDLPHHLHLFVGLPIPLPLGRKTFMLFEPYYRPALQLGQGFGFHELGGLVKLGF